MSQSHYEREMAAAAHCRDLAREAEQARLAASVADAPPEAAGTLLVALGGWLKALVPAERRSPHTAPAAPAQP